MVKGVFHIAGRPKGSKGKSKKRYITKVCSACPPEKSERPISMFYISRNNLNADGRISICKDCIKERCYNAVTDEIDIDALKSLLRQLDKPYIESAYKGAISEYTKNCENGVIKTPKKQNIIGYYFKNISSLRVFAVMSWEDGVKWEKRQVKSTENDGNKYVEPGSSNPSYNDTVSFNTNESDGFIITSEMYEFFGEGHKPYEYKAMWKKYLFLKDSYPMHTNLHAEALFSYIRFKVKEEIATSSGEVAEAEKWSKIASAAAAQAKINPNQLSKSDLQGGLNSFSELFQAVEQAVDIIPILPTFKYRPHDAIDFNIWCLVNYLRRLEGKPLCEYEDVYKFYDDRKRDYIEQYGDPHGIFTDDTTEQNRDNIKKFITLPTDYSDLNEDDSESEFEDEGENV